MSRTLLFVVNVDWFFLSHRLPIALEAMRNGYAVHIATRLTDRLDELQGHGLAVHPLTLQRGDAGLCNAWRATVELWRLFRMVRPDIVHLVTIKPVLLGGLIARLVRTPAVVVAVSGLGFVFLARGPKAWLRRTLAVHLYRVVFGHQNLKVIFQNPDDRASLAQLTRLPDNKVVMIHGSGVDLRRFDSTPMPTGVPVVLLAARLLADKGVREFVGAARLLKQRGAVARFCLVGSIDPANPASLATSELARWAADGTVELWGQRSDMPEVLRLAHIVVLPSYREGLPKVLLEAASCGRPVVTTDVPGCRDAVEPGVTGLLVPVRDVAALADVLQSLIDDPARCKVMGESGRALAARAFDIDRVVADHIRIYQELVDRS